MVDAYRLPTLPAVHARAMTVLNEPDVDMRQLATVVEADPALTAAVLRAANSAASAPVRRICMASEAVLRIGSNTTRRIMLGAVIGESFRGLHRAGIDAAALWRHVIACALLADGASDDGERSAAFTAGLLHDVGRMAMAQADPVRYARVVQIARFGSSAREAERDLFGHDHTEWGAEVARVWAVPDEVVEAIAGHHEGGAEGRGGALCSAVGRARRAAWSLGLGDGLCAPAEHAFPDDEGDEGETAAADPAMVERVGGAEAFREQVDWYCETVAGNAHEARPGAPPIIRAAGQP